MDGDRAYEQNCAAPFHEKVFRESFVSALPSLKDAYIGLDQQTGSAEVRVVVRVVVVVEIHTLSISSIFLSNTSYSYDLYYRQQHNHQNTPNPQNTQSAAIQRYIH
mgnify:CR=1 FL=1